MESLFFIPYLIVYTIILGLVFCFSYLFYKEIKLVYNTLRKDKTKDVSLISSTDVNAKNKKKEKQSSEKYNIEDIKLLYVLLTIPLIIVHVIIFLIYRKDLMCEFFSNWILISIPFVYFLVTSFIVIKLPDMNEYIIPAKKVKMRILQLFLTFLLSIFGIFSLFWCFSTDLFLIANETFCSEQEIVIEESIIDCYKSKNNYYIKFPAVSLLDRDLPVGEKKTVSWRNELYLKTLPYFSGNTDLKLKNTRTIELISMF